MNITRRGKSLFRSRAGFAGLFAAAALLTAAGFTLSPRAEAAGKPISTPQWRIRLEPTTPSGQLRVYPIQEGLSYWTPELPIYRGDTVKIEVFVATGANDLQELKIRVDNQTVADLTKAPWTVTLSTDKLDNGLHMVEAWMRVSDHKDPFQDDTTTFFVNTPPVQTAIALPPASQMVAGKSQTLADGKVTDVPLDSSAAVAPALPPALAGAKFDPGVTANIELKDKVTGAPVTVTAQNPLTSAAVASVVPASGSDVRQFAYAIVHNGVTSVAANQLYPVASTMIRLQPKTSTTPGLLSGTSVLWVWPVTSSGSYGAPLSMPVVIGSAAGG